MAARANSLTERVTKPARTACTCGACRHAMSGLRGRARPPWVRRRRAAGVGRPRATPTSTIPMRGFRARRWERSWRRAQRAAVHAKHRARTRADDAARRVSAPRLSRGHVRHGRRGRAAARAILAARRQSGRSSTCMTKATDDIRVEMGSGAAPFSLEYRRLADGPAPPRRDGWAIRGHEHLVSAHAGRRRRIRTRRSAAPFGRRHRGTA